MGRLNKFGHGFLNSTLAGAIRSVAVFYASPFVDQTRLVYHDTAPGVKRTEKSFLRSSAFFKNAILNAVESAYQAPCRRSFFKFVQADHAERESPSGKGRNAIFQHTYI